jgi:hypothetical protein
LGVSFSDYGFSWAQKRTQVIVHVLSNDHIAAADPTAESTVRCDDVRRCLDLQLLLAVPKDAEPVGELEELQVE